MGNTIVSFFFFSKNFKKIQHLAFTDKVKIVKAYVPEKVKIFIELNLLEELKFFQKKYSFKVEILSDEKLIIPEYKIDLLNKSKRLINSIENINKVLEIKKINHRLRNSEKKNSKKV